jgi:predicted GH43/DUF377 family glycosyl hydrolase
MKPDRRKGSVGIRDRIRVARCPLNPLIRPEDVKPSRPDWEVVGVFNAGAIRHGDAIILLLRVAERPRRTDPDKLPVPVLRAGAETSGGFFGGAIGPRGSAGSNGGSRWRELRESDGAQGAAGRQRLDGMQETDGSHGTGCSPDAPADRVETVVLDLGDPELDFSDSRVVRDRAGRTVYLTSLSHLRTARSRDGVRFTVDETPALFPEGPLESWGVEDPRITAIDGRYCITYSAVSERGVAVGLAVTENFRTYRRLGIILPPTNKDVVIFPERIGGDYWMLHRPSPDGIGLPEIWAARSPDLIHWGDHRYVMGVRDGTWESGRIGAGCVPIRTEAGWLVLYHGADRRDVYGMGAVLLDLHRPDRVIARLDEPFMTPTEAYETDGFFGRVVFACGAIVDGGKVMMYYGAADQVTARADIDLPSLLEAMQQR